MTEDRQDSLSFLDPGVTPEKTRLLVRQIFRSTTSMTTRWVPYDPAAHKLRVLVARITDAKGRVTEFDF